MPLDQSFPKDQHLRASKDIRSVIETGYKFVSFSLIFYAKHREGSPLKACFIVSRKIGNAVRRNRVKRLMREAFRTRKELFNDGLWLVFIARAGIDDWSYLKVCKEIKVLSDKLKNRLLAF